MKFKLGDLVFYFGKQCKDYMGVVAEIMPPAKPGLDARYYVYWFINREISPVVYSEEWLDHAK